MQAGGEGVYIGGRICIECSNTLTASATEDRLASFGGGGA